LSTAAFLARRLDVSGRTIYRDIADLQRQGVPIEGEAGIGYRLGAGFRLPPLMFSAEEACALVAAARIAQHQLDPALTRSLSDALGKVLGALPPLTRHQAEALPVYAPPACHEDGAGQGADAVTQTRLQALRQAIASRHKLRLRYRAANDAETERTVRPLACFYWGRVWTLGAWCELRADFRSFRLDRIAALHRLHERFRDESGRALADFFRHVGVDAARLQEFQ
jgi:predicted DNA-binding transcriptional regulator YafY